LGKLAFVIGRNYGTTLSPGIGPVQSLGGQESGPADCTGQGTEAGSAPPADSWAARFKEAANQFKAHSPRRSWAHRDKKEGCIKSSPGLPGRNGRLAQDRSSQQLTHIRVEFNAAEPNSRRIVVNDDNRPIGPESPAQEEHSIPSIEEEAPVNAVFFQPCSPSVRNETDIRQF